MTKFRSALATCLFLTGLILSQDADATILTVSSLADSGPGSLRDQVAAAAPGDTIDFSVTGTIDTVTPPISIDKDLTIIGPGAGILTISGVYNTTGTRSSDGAIFKINSGIVGISGLTLRDGAGAAIGNEVFGGAICMTGGTATVAGCVLTGNRADYGGAIALTGGSLTISGTSISNNDIGEYRLGGGIYTSGGTLAVTSSTVSGNIAGFGGGILNDGGTVTIWNSCISGNTAKSLITRADATATFSRYGWGGGIFNSNGSVTITNSTLSGNVAQGDDGTTFSGGGGIYTESILTVVNSTIAGNFSVSGGGIQKIDGTVSLSNSIVADNSAPTGADISGTSTGDYNLVQKGSFPTGTNNITGQDAKLGVLSSNGGPTKTHALLSGSPALDAGDPNFNATNMPYDQRGVSFPRVKNGRIDIGAWENEVNQSGFIVNTLADHDDGICGVSDCTLREAVKYSPAGASITFSVTGTITLTDGELAIAKNLTITGPTSAPGITVSGNNQSRIFSIVTNPVTGNNSVSVSNLTLSGGNGVGASFSGNGGGISNDLNQTLNVANCTFSGNTAASGAGAIRNAGTLTVTNSTFFGNSAISGGAIRSGGALAVANSTIFGNTATGGFGGGILKGSGTWFSLSNSIVAGNSAPTGPDISGPVAGGGYNLVGKGDGSTGLTHGTNGNQVGTIAAPLNPLLGALASNGGPTKTLALLAGSPAIDTGDPAFAITNTPYDQRGLGFVRKSSSAIDIGAYEAQVSIDTMPPTISISAPSVTLANSSSTVTYTVTYGDANFSSSTLSASNVTLNRAGTINATVSVTSSSVTTRTVTLSGITGYGTLGISVVAGTATDSTGNPAPAAGPSSTFTVNPSVETVQLSGTIRAAVGGGFAVGYIGNPGQGYTVQFSPDLTPSSWQTLGTQVADSSGVISIIDNPPVGTPKRFYRLRLP